MTDKRARKSGSCSLPIGSAGSGELPTSLAPIDPDRRRPGGQKPGARVGRLAHRVEMEFIQDHGALSVIMTNDIIGCPHQEGIDYDGEWCPVCEFWRGRDRFTGQMLA